MKNILDKMASRGVEALSDRELLTTVRWRVSATSPKPACAWSGDWA